MVRRFPRTPAVGQSRRSPKARQGDPLKKFAIAALAAVACLWLAVPAAAAVTASEVSVGSPSGQTPRNHQNEPAVAIDAHVPNIAVAGWNDFVDWSPCPQQTATEQGNCARPEDSGVGLSGVAFSFNSGQSWVQPTYTGLDGGRLQPDRSLHPPSGADPHPALVLRE
jgi:hypothetical protein